MWWKVFCRHLDALLVGLSGGLVLLLVELVAGGVDSTLDTVTNAISAGNIAAGGPELQQLDWVAAGLADRATTLGRDANRSAARNRTNPAIEGLARARAPRR